MINNVNKRIGYARVSTADQSLDMQIDALIKAGCDRKDVYEEKASGAKDDRRVLAEVLRTLRPGDTLVVYKLDRLARSTRRLIEIAEVLAENNVELVSVQDGIDTTTPTGRAMFKMIGIFAELEREMIVERTKAGLIAARARGRVGGRPRTDKHKLDYAIRLYNDGEHSVPQITEIAGVSKPALYRELNRRKQGAE